MGKRHSSSALDSLAALVNGQQTRRVIAAPLDRYVNVLLGTDAGQGISTRRVEELPTGLDHPLDAQVGEQDENRNGNHRGGDCGRNFCRVRSLTARANFVQYVNFRSALLAIFDVVRLPCVPIWNRMEFPAEVSLRPPR